MMSNADSLNELINWITEDVTNDTSIALYAFEEEEREQQQHQEASKKNNNMSNHKTRFLGSSCSFKLEQKYTRFEIVIGGFVHQSEHSPNAES